MKKIIIALMALTITFGLLGIATYGVFALPEDNNNINNNPLSLDVEGRNVANESYSFENIAPGDSAGWNGALGQFDELTWTVENTGTLDGTLEVSIENIEDNSALLSTKIFPQMWVDGVLVKEASNLGALQVFQKNLDAGEETVIDIAWKFCETAGNEFQGALTTFDVNFYISAPAPDIDPPVAAVVEVEPIVEEVVDVPPVITVAEEVIEVLPIIEVLPLTGYNFILIPISLSLILAGLILAIYFSYIKRKSLFGKK